MCYVANPITTRQQLYLNINNSFTPVCYSPGLQDNCRKSYDDLIQAGRDDALTSKLTNNATALEGITHFLCNDSKVTMDHKG